MHRQINASPIIQAGPSQFAIIDAKSKRFNQVQSAAGCRAQTRHVTRIGRNLRLDQGDMERRAHNLKERFNCKLGRCDDVRNAFVAQPNSFQRFPRVRNAHLRLRRVVDQAVAAHIEAP